MYVCMYVCMYVFLCATVSCLRSVRVSPCQSRQVSTLTFLCRGTLSVSRQTACQRKPRDTLCPPHTPPPPLVLRKGGSRAEALTTLRSGKRNKLSRRGSWTSVRSWLPPAVAVHLVTACSCASAWNNRIVNSTLGGHLSWKK